MFYWKYQNKVRLGFILLKKLKIRYGWKFILLKTRCDLGLIHSKVQKLGKTGDLYIEHEKIRYVCGFISLKMLKFFTAEDLFLSKWWNKVRLWIYSNERNRNKAQLGIYSIEKAGLRYGWGQPRPQRIFLL